MRNIRYMLPPDLMSAYPHALDPLSMPAYQCIEIDGSRGQEIDRKIFEMEYAAKGHRLTPRAIVVDAESFLHLKQYWDDRILEKHPTSSRVSKGKISDFTLGGLPVLVSMTERETGMLFSAGDVLAIIKRAKFKGVQP